MWVKSLSIQFLSFLFCVVDAAQLVHSSWNRMRADLNPCSSWLYWCAKQGWTGIEVTKSPKSEYTLRVDWPITVQSGEPNFSFEKRREILHVKTSIVLLSPLDVFLLPHWWGPFSLVWWKRVCDFSLSLHNIFSNIVLSIHSQYFFFIWQASILIKRSGW